MSIHDRLKKFANSRLSTASDLAAELCGILITMDSRIVHLESRIKQPEDRTPTIKGLEEMCRRRDVTIEENQKTIRELETVKSNLERDAMNLRTNVDDLNKRLDEIRELTGVKL